MTPPMLASEQPLRNYQENHNVTVVIHEYALMLHAFKFLFSYSLSVLISFLILLILWALTLRLGNLAVKDESKRLTSAS